MPIVPWGMVKGLAVLPGSVVMDMRRPASSEDLRKSFGAKSVAVVFQDEADRTVPGYESRI